MKRMFSHRAATTFICCLLSSVLTLAPLPVYADQHEQPAGEEFLSLNFRDVDIRQFIESVSKLTRRNFLIDSRVGGRVTIIAAEPIRKDELYDVLLSVLHFYGFAAIPDGSITKIVVAADAPRIPPSEEQEEPHAVVSEIIKVHNLNVGELLKVIRPMLSQRASVAALPKGDSIIISDTHSSLDRIKQVIKRIDVVEIQDYEIITLNHALVDDVVKMISTIYKSNNRALKLNIQPDKRTNRMIVSGSSEVRRAIRALAESLDTPLSSSANIKVVYLRYADAQNLANILTRLTSSEAFKAVAASGAQTAQQPAQQPAEQAKPPQPQPNQAQQPQPVATGAGIKSGIQADVALNALIISGDSNFIAAAEDIIRQLDVARAQIVIEVIIAELTDTLTRELGVDWIYNTPSTGAGIIDLSGRLPVPAANQNFNTAGIAGSVLSTSGISGPTGVGVLSAAYSGTVRNGWAALFKFLDTDQRANILSTPYLVTLDNEEASFTVGENRPFQVTTTDSDGDRIETTQRRDVGTTLVLKPQVTGGDSVKLTIDQEVSNVVPQEAEGELVTSERKIKTTVQVRDGGLIVLGGLLREEQNENSNKAPGLADIPVLGYLFKNQRSSIAKTNLVLFMRPRIVKDEASIASISHGKYNSIRQGQLDYPRFNSLFPSQWAPKLRELSKVGLFTDLGRPRSFEDLVDQPPAR